MTIPDLTGLPGAERIERGIADLQRGCLSVDALLLAVASRRLRALGVPVPQTDRLPRDPDLALYDLLQGTCRTQDDDPYFRYNALRSELSSFLEALEARSR